MNSSKIKRNDLILVGVVLMIAILSYAGISIAQSKTTENPWVVITADGEEIGRYDLNENTEVTIPLLDGEYNHLVIENKEAYITEASCPDQICVNHSAIHSNGEMIVCLPHKLIVQIENAKEQTVDAIVR